MSDAELEHSPSKKQKTAPNEDQLSPIPEEPDITEDSIIDQDGIRFWVDNPNYNYFEEIEKLKEFRVLDEVKSNDEETDEEGSESSDGMSKEVPEEEIEKMLEDDLPDDFKGAPKPEEKQYQIRQKIVLEDKGINYLEALPLDWVMVKHYSGVPVYLHLASRVCTLSKPYFLGKGSARSHDIPISAIPCYNYRKALEEEAKQKEIDRGIAEQIKNGMWQQNDRDKISNHVSDNDENVVNNSNEINAQSSSLIISNKKTSLAIEDPSQMIKHASSEFEKEVDNQENLDVNIMNSPNIKTSKCPFMHLEGNPNAAVNCENSQETDKSTEKGKNIDESSVENNDDTKAMSSAKPVVLPGGIVMPPPRVETVNTSGKTQQLTHEQVNDYCKKLFKFKTVNIKHFRRWADRRKYAKTLKTPQYPTLPEGTKLITIPAQPSSGPENEGVLGGGSKYNKRDWVMTMNGRSHVSVFHEYVRRTLQKQPVYEFKQIGNTSTPYQATVSIDGMQYGVGCGTSKRLAKAKAVRASIEILIPEMKDELGEQGLNEPDLSFFDSIGIEDPRITEFCVMACEPSPHVILGTCLRRNFGTADRHIRTEMKKLENRKIELTMKVGKHSATVACKNKKIAKQRASQAILQALHPHVSSWGSLLRLYGSRSVKSCKQNKLEEQEITLLQDKARHNEPNYAVLEKLRNEMRRLRERDEAFVPIGTLTVQDDLPTHSGSNLNNVDL